METKDKRRTKKILIFLKELIPYEDTCQLIEVNPEIFAMWNLSFTIN